MEDAGGRYLHLPSICKLIKVAGGLQIEELDNLAELVFCSNCLHLHGKSIVVGLYLSHAGGCDGDL